jgi:hypothetical protein
LRIIEDLFPAWNFYNHNLYNLNWDFRYDGDSTVTQGDGYLSFICDRENAVYADSRFKFTPNFEAYADMRSAVEYLYFSATDTTNYVSLAYNGGDYIATVYTGGVPSSCWGRVNPAPADDLFIVDYLSITAVHVANKYVPLRYIPNEYPEVVVNVVGGTSQNAGTDYYVQDSKIKWDGMGLDGAISAGDVLRVVYIGDDISSPIQAKLSVTDGTAAVNIYDYGSRTWRLVKKKALVGVGGSWSASLFMDATANDSDFYIQKTFLITDDPWWGSYEDEGYGNRIQNTYF